MLEPHIHHYSFRETMRGGRHKTMVLSADMVLRPLLAEPAYARDIIDLFIP